MKNLIKIKSYMGLAVRARKVAVGTNDIIQKKCDLIIVSSALSENALNKIKNHKNPKTRLEIFDKDDILFITDNPKILALGIMDNGLAKAVIDNL